MQRRPIVAAALALVSVFAVSLATAPANATERQHALGIGLGLTLLKVDANAVTAGVGTGLTYSYGLTDQFNLVAEGGFARVSFSESQDAKAPHNRPTNVSNAGVGVTYVLDVLRWVPYFGVLGAGYVLNGGSMDKAKAVLGGQLALGLDYKIDSSFTVGVAVRQHMLFGAIDTYPSYTTAFVRAEYVWGW